MTVVKIRWHCDTCDNVCEKRPFFNVYVPGRKNAVGPEGINRPGAQWLCVNCGHTPPHHSFTFNKPKDQKDD